ncbi:MAG: tRNA threonylcarbamoyladenosine dehydratase [Oscillospiraceae bacterium]|nr:tRNA threonylcarbamoyladenosine dehydratase [Oscillospiraceae bacterium]
MNPYSRTEFLLGKAAMEKLHRSRVAVFGLGGVGGYAVEALARSGIGALTLIDHDTVSLTNLNRQILATRDTVGKSKAQAAAQRVQSIDPEIQVEALQTFFGPETAEKFDFSQYDYVIDAIDTVTGKLALVAAAKAADTPIICAMGAGNKLDPTAFQVADIYETSVCPLARIMRKECRKRGIDRLKVVYSQEDPIACTLPPDDPAWAELPEGRNALPGSCAFVPSVMGLIIAGEVIKDLVKE